MTNDDVYEMIVAVRGGIPERCDFCGERYTDTRYPIPEEAGEWACSECWERWQEEDKPC